MIHVILSLDCELCGNGSGDVMRDIIEPTRRMLNICDRHQAKMTIMFEVGEYWAFEKYEHQLHERLGYSPSEQMREQAVDAVGRGHDVQLHLHPQWIDARYEGGAWRLRNSCWRLADLPDGLGNDGSIASITGALSRGKQTLDSMIKPVKSDYQCVCFRAGGLYAQPSRDIISAMKRAGLRADSSVAMGYKKESPFAVDYSEVNTSKTAWWTTDTELTMEGKPGENIIELSVGSKMEPYWKTNLKLAKLRSISKYWRIESGSRGDCVVDRKVSSLPSCAEVLRRLLRKRVSLFDCCTLSSRSMVNRLQEYADDKEGPVVIIGHSKDFANDRQFEKFLALLRRDKRVSCLTISEYVQKEFGLVDTCPLGDRHQVNLGLTGTRQ